VEARRADRQTSQYQDERARDIEAYRQECPPSGIRIWSGPWRAWTGIDRATISKLETGEITNPTIGTLMAYAKALGRRLAWTLEMVAKPDVASQ
jgi:hypothetical protein